MKTTIDNNLRVFQIVTSTGKQVFCNLDELNNVMSNLGTHAGYFKIWHFWDNKPKRVSRKYIDEMYAANNDKRTFNM
jgi:hypothetical protein